MAHVPGGVEDRRKVVAQVVDDSLLRTDDLRHHSQARHLTITAGATDMTLLPWKQMCSRCVVRVRGREWAVDMDTLEVTCDDLPKGHALDLTDVERRLIGVVPVYPSGYFLKEDVL